MAALTRFGSLLQGCRGRAVIKEMSAGETYIAGGTELPLSIFDLRAELLQQCFLNPPDWWGLSACLQGHLGGRYIDLL